MRCEPVLLHGAARRLRLRFPTPITDLRELPLSLAWVLDPGCRCCPSRRSTGAAGG